MIDKININLYNKKFYTLSCLSNISSYIFTYFLAKEVGYVAIVFGTIQLLFVSEIGLKHFTKEMYNHRYIVTIVSGMVMITFSMFDINKDYVLFLPIMLGFMYLSVNNFIMSKIVKVCSIIFMLTPIAKVFVSKNYSFVEYFGVLSIFTFFIYVTNKLFVNNYKNVKELEQKAEEIKSIFKLMSHLTIHDINNELQKMQILATKKYRNDPELFVDTLSDFTNSLMSLSNMDIFDNFEDIYVASLISNMNHVTNKASIDYVELDDSTFYTNKNILYSTIKNFLENSIEANSNCFVVVIKEKDRITIIDDCGGFDLETMKGKTTKEKKNLHGIFLKTITDPSIKNLFNFEVKIDRMDNGTRVKIVF